MFQTIGHSVSDCRSNFKCFKFDVNHHIAVCTFKPTKKEDTDNNGNQVSQTANNYASSLFQVFKNDSTLLQIARADVFSPNEKQTLNIRILFDNSAQFNYISPKTCRDLKLSPIDKKEISIITFRKHVTLKTIDIVQVAIKAKNSDMKIYINAFVSDICYHPLEEQNIDLSQEQFKNLKNLYLADRNPEGLPMNIDILIDCQNYWDFIGYKQIHGESGPVAIASRLGFVLSGPYGNTKNISNTSVKFVNSHLMKVESLVHESIKVEQDLSSIFQQKHTNDFSFSQKGTPEFFDNTTVFENNRYEAKLPFKDKTDVNPNDNYSVRKNPVKNFIE